MGMVVGVDLGGTFVKAGIVQDRSVLRIARCPTQAEQGADVVIANIITLIQRLLREEGTEPAQLEGIGVAVPSPISPDMRTPVDPPNCRCLNGVPVAERVAEAFGCRGVIENDANAAALGEMFYGARRGKNDLIVLTLGTGVGGGVITGGQLLRGATNAAGELGHILVAPEGRVCGCGRRGCLEAQISIGGLLARARQLCPDLSLDQETGPRVLSEAARAGDRNAAQVFAEMGAYLGAGIADLTNIFGPEAVILTGGISNSFDLFQPALLQALKEQCRFPTLLKAVSVEVSTLGENAPILGAAAAFLQMSELPQQPGATPGLVATVADRKDAGGTDAGAVEHSRPAIGGPRNYTIPVATGPFPELVLAVQIGVTRTRAALVRANGDLVRESLRLKRRDRETRQRENVTATDLMNEAVSLAREAAGYAREPITAVVLIVPCGVHRERGFLLSAPGISPLGGHQITSEFDVFGMPVYVENDANAALLFDYRFGVAREHDNVLGVHLVSGLGGAMVIHGRLLVGKNGHALEIGHVPFVKRLGKLCGCGNTDCLECYASGASLEKAAGQVEGDPIEVVEGNYMDVLHAAQRGHREARELMDAFSTNLAEGLIGTLNTFDPEVVILTGALSRAKDYCLGKVREIACEKAFAEIGDNLEVRVTADPYAGELRAAPVIAKGLCIRRGTTDA
jgi:glucokinase